MHWNKLLIFGVCALACIGGLQAQDSLDVQSHLWNVTDQGDTLRYLNLIPRRTPGHVISQPRYVSEARYRDFLSGSEARQDSQLVLFDLSEFELVDLPQLQDARSLQPVSQKVWMPVVAMTVTGALSAYFKLEANGYYNKYQHALDSPEINKYYDLTRKYDTYSAISFVLLQGSFGWLIYKLIW